MHVNPQDRTLQVLFMRKFRNIPTIVNGEKFDSKGEAVRWQELKYLEMAGEIVELTRQVKYELKVNGVKICSFVPDFEYVKDGVLITEDFKSSATMTPTFRLKAKLFKAIHGREIFISKK